MNLDMVGSFRARGVEGLCVFAHEWLGIHFAAASSALNFVLVANSYTADVLFIWQNCTKFGNV